MPVNSPKGELGGALTPLNDAKIAISQLKQNLINKGEATKLFAQERNNGLNAIWGALDQSVFGEPAYPSIESKAAHLLYFVVKNHPFSDGNKRTAAFLFVDFLNRNQRLLNENYQPVINDTGLAAITLLVAESNPKEKGISKFIDDNSLSEFFNKDDLPKLNSTKRRLDKPERHPTMLDKAKRHPMMLNRQSAIRRC